MEAVPTVVATVAMLDGTEMERDTEAGEAVEVTSSSSFDLSKSEISTMGGTPVLPAQVLVVRIAVVRYQPLELPWGMVDDQ